MKESACHCPLDIPDCSAQPSACQTSRCAANDYVKRLVKRAVEAERLRADAEEWELWNNSFGWDVRGIAKTKPDKATAIASSCTSFPITNRPS